MFSFTEAIRDGHHLGLKRNDNSYIIGLGVNYSNGADGTTAGLSDLFNGRLMDTPVSEAANTGMCVGMATAGLNPIVHHGRVEFALLAMDQILTQAAKWDYMFGGDYSCPLGVRLNIGRQWGNGPQHTSSYNSLFLNTPGLDIFWPSRPSEAFRATHQLHSISKPTLQMEHRWLFKTVDNKSVPDAGVPLAAVYGPPSENVLLTYGDGLVEALKLQGKADQVDVTVICLTAFVDDRELPGPICDIIGASKRLLLLDTSNYQYGLLQGIIGQLAEKAKLPKMCKVFSPPFIPVATAAGLVNSYYPVMPDIIEYFNDVGLNGGSVEKYSFDEVNLPPNFDFSDYDPNYIYKC